METCVGLLFLHGCGDFLSIVVVPARYHLQAVNQNKRKWTMSAIRSSVRTGFFGRAFAVLGAANAVSAAVEAGRRPRARDLRELGIDPAAFGQASR
ncbi:UNVERIFIED_ORG: hypothetical protein GGI57_002813 [Rhizobium aethiopicum]